MINVIKRKYYALFLLFLFLVGLMASGCSTIPEAIENRKLYIGAKMSEPIFLDPVKKARLRTIYVEVRNTSQLQKLNPTLLRKAIEEKLREKGYTIVSNPLDAGYIVQVQVRYFDFLKEKTGTKEGAAAGAIVGGGAALSGDAEKLILAALAAGVGYTGGALVGSLVSINTFAGYVDLQIMERSEKPIKKEIVTEARQGTETVIRTKQTEETSYQIYRNGIAVTVTKTNLSEEEAVAAIIDKLSHEIAGIF